MSKEYIIRRMRADEVQVAIDWAQKEGWNPGLNDAECFYQADSQGFFIGLLNDEPISVGAAVAYGNDFAFCGLYIVKEEYRNHGYGMKLTEELLKYAGNRLTGLDGVLDKVKKYERLGYVPAHRNIRYSYEGNHSFKLSPNIRDLKNIPFSQLESYDKQYFPGLRKAFLKNWIVQPLAKALGYFDHNLLKGYGVVRKCYEGYKIGPLFAESSSIAQALFEALTVFTEEGPIYLDCPEPNRQAKNLVNFYNMNPRFEVIRMYRNGHPKLPLDHIYGITTFELG